MFRRMFRALVVVLPLSTGALIAGAAPAHALFIPCGGFKSIGLSPISAANAVGTTHTVTATDACGGVGLLPNDTLVFTVISGPNAGATGTVDTNGFGQAAFTYASNGLTGTDTIRACDAGVPATCSNDVTKSWGGVAQTPNAAPFSSPFGAPFNITYAPRYYTNDLQGGDNNTAAITDNGYDQSCDPYYNDCGNGYGAQPLYNQPGFSNDPYSNDSFYGDGSYSDGSVYDPYSDPYAY